MDVTVNTDIMHATPACLDNGKEPKLNLANVKDVVELKWGIHFG
jgi:hypothetical protein